MQRLDAIVSRSMASPSAGRFGDEYLDWKHWEETAFGGFQPDQAVEFAAETGITRGEGLRVLELGFGNGSLLAWLVSMGAETYGVEANPRLVEHATRLLGAQRAFASLDAPALVRLQGSFQCIVAIDVLEHVPQTDIPPLLGQLASLLDPSGRIVARFPNGDSPFGRIYQHGDPTHVTTIGRAKLEYFARRAGLTVAELRAPALPLRGIGFRRGLRRAALLAARSVVERVVGALYFGGRRLPLDPNYVAVLRRTDAAQR